jgi:hypothetical protein
MTEVFIIMGATGDYSDRCEWPVAVVDSREAAEQYVKAVTAQYQNVPTSLRNRSSKRMKELMTLDPDFETDYTGTSYWFAAVDFITADELAAKLAA